MAAPNFRLVRTWLAVVAPSNRTAAWGTQVMSEIRRTEKRMVEQEFVVEHVVTCDLCGLEAKKPGGYPYPSWREYHPMAIDAVVVGTKRGASTPDGGWTDEEVFDICPKCFDEKLKPFLLSLGAQPRAGRVDW